MDDNIRHTFWTEFAKSPFVMVRLAGNNCDGQPMTAMLDKDAHHAIWFYLSRTTTLAQGGPAKADLSSKAHKLFAAMTGNLSVETDRAVFEKLWSNKVGAWFKGGKNDPALIMMRFDIDSAEIWQTDMSIMGLFHLFTGQLIQPNEAGHHAIGQV